jgi:hypothetical protein
LDQTGGRDHLMTAVKKAQDQDKPVKKSLGRGPGRPPKEIDLQLLKDRIAKVPLLEGVAAG